MATERTSYPLAYGDAAAEFDADNARVRGDKTPQQIYDQFEADRGLVNSLWLHLRDAVLLQYDQWAESSAETRRLRDVARQISGIPADYVNTVVVGSRGQPAEVVQPYRKPHDAMICLPRGPMAPAWAAWINEARELIEIVEKSAPPPNIAAMQVALPIGSEPDHDYGPLDEDEARALYELGHHGPKDRDRR